MPQTLDNAAATEAMSDRLSRYADLIVRVGANVQSGQTVFVNGLVEHAPLIRSVVESAYQAGARYVDVDYRDQHIRKSLIRHVPEDDLTVTKPWHLARCNAFLDGAAAIHISGEPEPGLLSDLDQRRVGKARPIEAVETWTRAVSERIVNWTIAAHPTSGQAEQVFGEPDLEKLWDAVLSAVRLNDPDPVSRWREHLEMLAQRCSRLNELALDALRFTGPGTDLTIGLLKGARWSGGTIETRDGIRHVANMPTEEVFVCPDWRRTEGRVRATRPLALGGTIVRDLELRFEAGEIVEVAAASGADAVRGQLEIDHAGRLGEVALVDGDSAVGKTGLTFFDTLFDENATCHIAYGAGVAFGIDGIENRSPEELRERGVNVAAVHTDFMIGGPEVTVCGQDANGQEIPILEDDVWQLG